MSETYDWMMTNDPWLDGVIFGAGVPKTKSTIMVDVSDLPATISDRILRKFIERGYEADYIEMPKRYGKKYDISLVIEAVGPSPVFGILPRFRERRLTDEVPSDFLRGFFTVVSRVKFADYSTKYRRDGFVINFPMLLSDIIKYLGKIGVKDYEILYGKVFLPVDSFRGISPFDELYIEYLKEKEELEKILPDRMELLEELSVKLDKNTYNRIVLEIVNKIHHLDTYISKIKGDIYKNTSFPPLVSREELLNTDPIWHDIIHDYEMIFSKQECFSVAEMEYLKEHYQSLLSKLFTRSIEYDVFLEYLRYCMMKQELQPDISFSPSQLVRGTHRGNIDMARFFLIYILSGKPKSDKSVEIPFLKEQSLTYWKNKITDTFPLFLDIFKYFTGSDMCGIFYIRYYQ